MTPFDRLSAVLSEVPQTDMLLLSLLVLAESTSSVYPATARERPTGTIIFWCLYPVTSLKGNLCFFLPFFLWEVDSYDPAAA